MSRLSGRCGRRDGSARDAPRRAGRAARKAAKLDALRTQLLRALRTHAVRRAAATAATAGRFQSPKSLTYPFIAFPLHSSPLLSALLAFALLLRSPLRNVFVLVLFSISISRARVGLNNRKRSDAALCSRSLLSSSLFSILCAPLFSLSIC